MMFVQQYWKDVSVKVFNQDIEAEHSVVVYFHGFPGPIPGLNPKSPLAPQLANGGEFRIFAPEYLGLGSSGGKFSFSETLSTSLSVFEEVRQRHPNLRISLIGYSWGALPALKIWREASHASLDRLLLLAPAYLYPGRPQLEAIAAGWRHEFKEILSHYEDETKIAEEIENVLGVVDPVASFCERSNRISVIHGTSDDVIPFASSKVISDRFSSVRLLPIEQASHDFEDRDKLIEVMRHELVR